MAAVIRSRASVIIPLIRARIMAKLAFPAERVFYCQRPPPFDSQADQYVWLRKGRAKLDRPVWQGGGRVDTRRVLMLECNLRTRLATDETDRDNAWLFETSLGHEVYLDTLYDALQGFQPVDAQGNWTVTQPIEVTEEDAPDKDKISPEWGESTLNVEVHYEMDLDQTYQ